MSWLVFCLGLLFQEPALTFTADEQRLIQAMRLGPVPADPTNRVADDARAVAFGRRLFFETRFSVNNQVSCGTCHQPGMGFADQRARSVGLSEVRRHTPTVVNAVYQRWFFWDGRADSLWAQALAPWEDPAEFGGNRVGIVRVVATDPALAQAYQEVFGPLPEVDQGTRFPAAAKPDPEHPESPLHQAWMGMNSSDQEAVTTAFVNLGKAVAAYERTLVSRNTPLDALIEDLAQTPPRTPTRMNRAAQQGLKLFLGKAGCRNCHSGPTLSDREFHNTGAPGLDGTDSGRYEGVRQLLNNPFRANGNYSDAPTGQTASRLAFLKQNGEQWGQFKTPGLRDVARTAPYMHQGQLKTLAEVVHFYNTLEGQVQLGHHQDPLLRPLGLSHEEEAALVAFLENLTGDPVSP